MFTFVLITPNLPPTPHLPFVVKLRTFISGFFLAGFPHLETEVLGSCSCVWGELTPKRDSGGKKLGETGGGWRSLERKACFAVFCDRTLGIVIAALAELSFVQRGCKQAAHCRIVSCTQEQGKGTTNTTELTTMFLFGLDSTTELCQYDQ